jgi:hypothetical protein
MPATEMIIMIAIVAALALVTIQLFRLAATGIRHRTVRQVIDRDPSAAEAVMAELRMPETPRGDDRLGIILVAFGLAMIGASVFAGHRGNWADYGIAGALFPLIVGAALWLRHYAIERARRGETK